MIDHFDIRANNISTSVEYSENTIQKDGLEIILYLE